MENLAGDSFPSQWKRKEAIAELRKLADEAEALLKDLEQRETQHKKKD